MHLLVTRPEPDATALAGRLAKFGHQVTLAPLFEVRFLHPDPLPLDGVQALVATSRNALRALAQNPSLDVARKLPLFSVGAATTRLAESLGFETIHTGDQSAKSLPELIKINTAPDAGPLLYLAGKHLARNTGEELARLGFTLSQTVLYESVALDTLAPEVVAKLRSGEIDGVLIMSPRTATHFATLIKMYDLEPMIPTMTFFCLSRRVADALDGAVGHTDADRRVSEIPRLETFIAMINAAAGTGEATRY